MLEQRWNQQWHRWSAGSLALLMVATATPIWGRTEAVAQDLTSVKACTDKPLLLPAHPDVDALQRLFERYVGRPPAGSELGMTRLDFARDLALLSARMNALKTEEGNRVRAQDWATLQRLEQTYRRELAQLRRRRTDVVEDSTFTSRVRRKGQGANGSPPLPTAPLALPLPPPPPPPPRPSPVPVPGRAQPESRQQVKPVAPPSEPPVFDERNRINLPGTFNTEDYNRITENPFQRPITAPLSTFSIDVDTASYSNVRRFIRQGQMPPKDAVRIEELVNYFSYDYPKPEGDRPFSVTTEVATTPWNPDHKLVQIGLKGKELETANPAISCF